MYVAVYVFGLNNKQTIWTNNNMVYLRRITIPPIKQQIVNYKILFSWQPSQTSCDCIFPRFTSRECKFSGQ